jgi:Spy/CpxP family protein refolding chaperone
MHPGIYQKWKCARAAAEHGEHAGWHGSGKGESGKGESGYAASDRSFGVRRPLRFMAHRLELDDEQVQKLARILNDLKTERAQREVDHQRALSQIADLLAGEAFDRGAAEKALKSRLTAAERLEQAVLKALEETHAMLNPAQRTELAYMLRSGQLTI